MNWILLGIGALACAGLSSCGGMSGEQVDEPTVDKMSQLESQWGMKPRKTQPSRGIGGVTVQQPDTEDTPASNPAPQPAPIPEPPAPAPAPQPQATGVPDSTPPNLTTLQRLR